MSYHIDKGSIHVFPLAKNRSEDKAARLFYEDNIANIVRQVTDTTGFIIAPQANDLKSKISYVKSATQPVNGDLVRYDFILSDSFSFNLYGYYFMLDSGTKLVQVDFDATKSELQHVADIYAAIVVNDGEVQGQDDEGVYNGLHVLTSKPSTEDGYTAVLKLFSIDTSIINSNRTFDFIVDDSSYIKSNASSVNIVIKRIDGKRAL